MSVIGLLVLVSKGIMRELTGKTAFVTGGASGIGLALGGAFAQITELVKGGLDPSDVARRVLAAIRDDELYAFTHPQIRDTVAKRFAAILAAMDKAATH